MDKLIVIAGTNASGKSGLGVTLAGHYGGEIVSADEETVVKTSLIDEGFVLDTTLLGVTCESQAETGQQKNETTFFHERRKCW